VLNVFRRAFRAPRFEIAVAVAAAIGAALSVFADPSFAADTSQSVTVDMGANVRQQNVLVKPGDVVVILKNLLPRDTTTYTVSVEDNTANVLPPSLTPPSASLAADACKDAIAMLQSKLSAATTEFDVAKVEADLQALGTGKGSDPCSSSTGKDLAKQATDEFTKGTTKDLDKHTLESGESLDFTVNRLENKDKKVAAATTRITVGTPVPPSQWLTFYGFNFINSGDQTFFSKQTGTTPTVSYTITPAASRNPWVFAPSVYFIWLPSKNFDSKFARFFAWRNSKGDVFGGTTAGLGFDSSNPIVFAGYGVGWGYNVLATVGVVMHKEKRLNGQYSPNQVVTENLSSDLLLQDTYKSRFYVGLAFRFGSNPFASSKKPDSTPPSPAKAAPSTK
jgi:hypothetical protein